MFPAKYSAIGEGQEGLDAQVCRALKPRLFGLARHLCGATHGSCCLHFGECVDFKLGLAIPFAECQAVRRTG